MMRIKVPPRLHGRKQTLLDALKSTEETEEN